MVTKVLTHRGKATGIEYLKNGKLNQSFVGQVVLCAGAINSPHLLMLSGIGKASALEAQDISVISDSPGVGENLMDHLEVYVQYECKKPVSVYPKTRWFNMPTVGAQWLLSRRGAGATNHFEAGAFLRSNEKVAYPNLQFHFDRNYPGRNSLNQNQDYSGL